MLGLELDECAVYKHITMSKGVWKCARCLEEWTLHHVSAHGKLETLLLFAQAFLYVHGDCEGND